MPNTVLEPPRIEDTQFGEASGQPEATIRSCQCPCPCKTAEEMITSYVAAHDVGSVQGDP